jgi:hypothetical protein
MIRLLRLLCLAVFLPAAAMAQPVRVTSGEHDGFTRLVLDYGTALDWQIGRTTDGYELRLTDAAPTYDLTGVYDLIGRGRVASVWVDPQSGALRIGIGCACHAQPFEFRPGIVVIDLKDGPPLKGSAFETALNGETLRNLAPRPVLRPRAKPPQPARASGIPDRITSYDWTAAFLNPTPATPAVFPTPGLPDADPNLQPLRLALLQQLSRGASQGIVDMVLADAQSVAIPKANAAQLRVSNMPGVRIDSDEGAPGGLMAKGAACVADDRLDIATWGTDQPVSEQMAEAMSGLVGEFDTPDPKAELRAVRFFLFIGFGAEARQLLAPVSTTQPESGVLTSLAYILDDSRDPAPAFVGMAVCDTSAALWAILGDPAPQRGATFDRAATLRTFSALPVHMRRSLGPRLVDRLLGLNDAAAARTVRDAIVRAPGDAGPEVALMEARLDLDGGDAGMAKQRLEPLITTSGPATPDALIAQVETHLAQRAPIDPAQITALEALLHERGTGPDAGRFAVALTQARALAGDFDRAFGDLPDVPQAVPDVWSLLAEIGPDSALLSHAVWPTGTAPSVSAPVAAVLARRLSELGFSAQARDWLRQVPDADTGLAARIALQTGDARAAMRLVAGSDDPALVALRSEALYQLADEAALADVLASTGEDDARWRAISRARDWPQLAASGQIPLQALAAAAIGAEPDAPADPAGALARGEALLESSAQTRQQITDLLGSVTGPMPPQF